MYVNRQIKQLLFIGVVSLSMLNNFSYASKPLGDTAMYHMDHNHAGHSHVHHELHDTDIWMFDVMTMYMNMDGFQNGVSRAPAPDDMMVLSKCYLELHVYPALTETTSFK